MDARLEKADLIEGIFGKWPSFHDSEITEILLDRRGPTITIGLILRVAGGSLNGAVPDDTAHLRVTLRFYDVENLQIQDFNYQNVVFALLLTRIDEPRFTTGIVESRIMLTIESVFGAVCKFTCARGQVLQVEPTGLRVGDPPDPSAHPEDRLQPSS